jgi:hypothetical protein
METIMRSRDQGSDSFRSPIIDVEANPADHATGAPDDDIRPAPQTFRERHALKVMGGIMVAMFATVLIAQMGC